jgi:hypothetical protein
MTTNVIPIVHSASHGIRVTHRRGGGGDCINATPPEDQDRVARMEMGRSREFAMRMRCADVEIKVSRRVYFGQRRGQHPGRGCGIRYDSPPTGENQSRQIRPRAQDADRYLVIERACGVCGGVVGFNATLGRHGEKRIDIVAWVMTKQGLAPVHVVEERLSSTGDSLGRFPPAEPDEVQWVDKCPSRSGGADAVNESAREKSDAEEDGHRHHLVPEQKSRSAEHDALPIQNLLLHNPQPRHPLSEGDVHQSFPPPLLLLLFGRSAPSV